MALPIRYLCGVALGKNKLTPVVFPAAAERMTAGNAVDHDKIQSIDSRDDKGDQQGGFHSLPTAEACQIPDLINLSEDHAHGNGHEKRKRKGHQEKRARLLPGVVFC